MFFAISPLCYKPFRHTHTSNTFANPYPQHTSLLITHQHVSRGFKANINLHIDKCRDTELPHC